MNNSPQKDQEKLQLLNENKKEQTVVNKISYIYANYIFRIAQILSFFVSLLGMSLFFTEAPAGIDIIDFFTPTKNYAITFDIVKRFQSAGTPASIVQKLKSLSLSNKNYTYKKEFKIKLLTLFDFSNSNLTWLLNRRFNNLIPLITNNDEGFQLQSEHIDLVETNYNKDINFYYQKLGLHTTPINLKEILSPCLNISYDSKEKLENEIFLYGNEASMNLFIEALCTLCKIDFNWLSTKLIRLIIALFVAIIITGITYYSLTYIQQEGWQPYPIILCLLFGLILSSSSGFVVTWIFNQQKDYIQKSEKARIELLTNNLDYALKKAYEAYFVYQKNLGGLNELELHKKKLLWFNGVVDKYTNLMRIMENAHDASAKAHIKTFDDKFEDLLNFLKKDKEQSDIIIDNLKNVKNEIHGITGKKGYGPKARENLIRNFNNIILYMNSYCVRLKNIKQGIINIESAKLISLSDKLFNNSEECKKEAENKQNELKEIIKKIINQVNIIIENIENHPESSSRQHIVDNSLIKKFYDKHKSIEDYQNIFRASTNIKEKEYYFESILNECYKIYNFNFKPIKYNSKEGIHQIAIIRLFAMFFDTYFIPESNLPNVKKMFKRSKDVISLIREFNNDIYFSKAKWIDCFEDRSRIKLSKRQNTVIISLLIERSAGFSDYKTLGFAFIFDIASIVLTIIIRTIIKRQYIQKESKKELSQILLFFNNLKNRTFIFNYKWNKKIEALKRRLGSEEAQRKYEKEKETEKRMRDFRASIAEEWETYKNQDFFKDQVKHFLETEMMAMVMLQIPLEQHNNSLIKLNEFNTSLEETFKKNETIRNLYKNDIIEMQLYVEELKSIKDEADKFLNKLFQKIDSNIYDLTTIRINERAQSLKKREKNYKEKTTEFINDYKEKLRIFADKIDQYKYRGFFDQIDKKNKDIFLTSMMQIKDALNKIPEKVT